MTTHTYHRDLVIETRAADDEQRTAPAVISTEHPVRRGNLTEILEHTRDSVDLSRAPLPLIESHDTGTLNIGVVEGLRVVRGKLRGMVRFGSSARAREVWDDVKAGIVRNLSIGYEWVTWRREGDAVRVTRFMPFEVSLVAAGADPHAGLFRSKETTVMSDETETETQTRAERRAEMAAMRAEERRVEDIRFIADMKIGSDAAKRSLREYADRAIAEGWSPDTVREHRKMAIRAYPQEPIPISGGSWQHWAETGSFEGIEAREVHEPPAVSGGQHQRIVRAFADANGQNGYARAMRAGRQLLSTTGRRGYGRAQVEGISSAGGFLVPEELMGAIINLVDERGVCRRLMRVLPMSSDVLMIPRRTSGLTGGFFGEATEITSSDFGLDLVQIVAKKVGVLCKVSAELFEDSTADLAMFVADLISEEIARLEDQSLLLGDATSTYGGMTGLRTALTSSLAGGVTITNVDTFAEVTAAHLAQIQGTLPTRAHRRNPVWLCSQAAYSNVFLRLGAAQGGASMVEVQNLRTPRWAGYEIVISEDMPTDTGSLDGELMLAFGDFQSAGTLGLRRDMRLQFLDQRYAELDMVAWLATHRFAGVWHELGDASSAGEVVGLIGSA